MGFPDAEPIQEAMMVKIERRMAEAAEQFSPEALMGSWFSLFPQNPEWVQKMFAHGMGHNKPTKR